MTRFLTLAVLSAAFVAHVTAGQPPATPKVAIGEQAPAFKIKDASGKVIDLAELTAKGPVLVRLTCGCAGCDRELAYFQEIHDAYKSQGLTSLLVFKEPDAKVAQYAADKKLNMLYAVDSKGESGPAPPRRSVCAPGTMSLQCIADQSRGGGSHVRGETAE